MKPGALAGKGGGDAGDGGGDDPPIHRPPPKKGGGGTVIPPPPAIYRAADGSVVNVQLGSDGRISSAEATGKDGVIRRFSTGTNRWVQTFAEGSLPPLTISLALNSLRGIVRLTSEAGTVRLVYELVCTNLEDAANAAAANFQVTTTRFANGTQAARDVRETTGTGIQADFASAFASALSNEYQQLVLFFQPVIGTVISPPATPQERSRWAKVGRGVVWGLGALAAGALTGGSALVLGGAFLAGFDASMASDVVTDWENQTGPFQNTGGGGGEGGGGTGGGIPDGGGCFVEGTLVRAERGLVAIEQIRVDDSILAFDVEARGVVQRTVQKVFEVNRNEIAVLTFDDEEIRCTPLHRFFAGRWTAAKDLVLSGAVLGGDGRWHILKAIRFENRAQPVFNLTVSVTHTYLVGRASLVVHNTKTDGSTDDGQDENGDGWDTGGDF